MMGIRDYALGLEPGNCLPTGRHEMRKSGDMKYLLPGETKTYHFTVNAFDSALAMDQAAMLK